MFLTKVKACLWQVAEEMMSQNKFPALARCLKVSPVGTGKLKAELRKLTEQCVYSVQSFQAGNLCLRRS